METSSCYIGIAWTTTVSFQQLNIYVLPNYLNFLEIGLVVSEIKITDRKKQQSIYV